MIEEEHSSLVQDFNPEALRRSLIENPELEFLNELIMSSKSKYLNNYQSKSLRSTTSTSISLSATSTLTPNSPPSNSNISSENNNASLPTNRKDTPALQRKMSTIRARVQRQFTETMKFDSMEEAIFAAEHESSMDRREMILVHVRKLRGGNFSRPTEMRMTFATAGYCPAHSPYMSVIQNGKTLEMLVDRAYILQLRSAVRLCRFQITRTSLFKELKTWKIALIMKSSLWRLNKRFVRSRIYRAHRRFFSNLQKFVMNPTEDLLKKIYLNEWAGSSIQGTPVHYYDQ